MESEKQPVEAALKPGGGLLSELGNLLFKGLNGVLDRAAEYQEDYGVLKQVNVIPLVDQNGKQFTLTIKLAPVKDKQDLFFVEAETNAPGLDVSSINEKTVRLNTDTKERFNKMIEDLLNKNKLKPSEDENKDSDNSEEQADDEANEEGSDDENFTERLAELIDIVNDDLESERIFAKDEDGDKYEIVANLEMSDDAKHIEVTVVPYIDNEEADEGVTEEINSLDPRGDLIKLKDLKKLVVEVINDYLSDNGLKASTSILTSTCVKATFMKHAETGQIELKSISASSSLPKALDVIYSVTTNDEFIDMLTDEPQSFEITDVGDGYDVNKIDLIS